MTGKSNQPNFTLINMVQHARMAHDATAQPSQVSAVYWIEAKRQTDGAPPTSRAGQWVIHTTLAAVDALWATIKPATHDGSLGYKSKVSTSSRQLGVDTDDRVIYVVTYDADDSADVERVRAALVALGIDPAALTYTRDPLP